MGKRLREDMWLYVAPEIMGRIKEDGSYAVYDKLKKVNLDPTNIDDKITIYERQVRGWFLNHTKRLKKEKHAGFIILMIGISYIEGAQRYKEGKKSRKKSRACFKRGLAKIFKLHNINKTKLLDFYEQVRCGLFHTGMTEHKVIIKSSSNKVIDFSQEDKIIINHKKFIDKINYDFEDYIKKLRNPENEKLRKNFNNVFDVLP